MPAPERVPEVGLSGPRPRARSGDGDGGRDGAFGARGEVEALLHGELTVRGRIRTASNAVLYCEVEHAGRTVACVYKPVAGERPLWDFPDGTLAQREVAAYLVSEATGWGLVPPTVLRDGPFGQGMVQLWIDSPDDAADGPESGPDSGPESGPDGDAPAMAGSGAVGADARDGTDTRDGTDREGGADPGGGRLDSTGTGAAAAGALLALTEDLKPAPGWKAVVEAEIGGGRRALLMHADDIRLRRLAVLDAVINNADRKGGHLLRAPGGRVHGIDHGVTFHTDDKLRTLLWGWAGEPLLPEALTVLDKLAADLRGALGEQLAHLLTPAETAALRERVRRLRETGVHPAPGGDWPSIPWPPV